MFRVILVCVVITIRDMLNYLKIIHFHGKKVYLQVYGLRVIVIYPTSTCCNKFWWNIYYWVLNLKIFFFFPKPSIFTTLCQITSCNLQRCCDFFFSWWDAEEQGTSSAWNFFHVPHSKFFDIWSIGCFSSISLWSGPRTTVCYFCKLAMRKVDAFIVLCNASSGRDDAEHMVLCKPAGQECGAIKHILQEQNLSDFEVLGSWGSAS